MKHAAQTAMNDNPASSDSNSAPRAAGAASDPDSRHTFAMMLRNWLRGLVGPRPDTSLREALEETIEEHEEFSEERLAPEEKVMLHNVLSFGDIQVNDIMVPRTDIEAAPMDSTLCALKSHIIEHRHTRIPIYEDTLDHVRGFVHVKDLLPMLSGDEEYSLTAILRPLLFVPPSMRISDLLFKMRSAGCHMAIVVDEYGGTDGLVTMEDLFEEIVGEIHDEHDEGEDPEDRIQKVLPHCYEVNARIHIEKLEKALGLNLVTEENSGEFDTLGGLIFFQLGRVPVKGERVQHVSGIRFEIVDADPRRIHKVRIHTAA